MKIHTGHGRLNGSITSRIVVSFFYFQLLFDGFCVGVCPTSDSQVGEFLVIIAITVNTQNNLAYAMLKRNNRILHIWMILDKLGDIVDQNRDLGEVVLRGDFNAETKRTKCVHHQVN